MAYNDEPWRNSDDVPPARDGEDLLLLAVVHLVELGDATLREKTVDGDAAFGLGVTVLVGGALVSGTLISTGAYLRATSERWRRIFALLNPTGKRMENPYEGIFSQAADRHEAVARDPDYRARHVHLREARVVSPTGHAVPSYGPAAEGMLMRLPLARIDGWTLGSASPALAEQSDPDDDLDDDMEG
jgi:hypothetical protein